MSVTASPRSPWLLTVVTCSFILFSAVATKPSLANPACPSGPATLPEVVILAVPEASPPVVRVPLETREVNGEVRLQNVYGMPEIVHPRLSPVFEARPGVGGGNSCWRLARMEIRLEFREARLEVPEEFASNACLYIGALASALDGHKQMHALMHGFWQRVAPKFGQYVSEFQPARGEDRQAVEDRFDRWLAPRLLDMVERLQAEDGGPRFPTQDISIEAGRRSCPTFIDELTRFKAALQPARRATPI